MNILVTGAAGFIGSHVVDALLERGDKVAGLDNFDPYYDPARKRANIEHALRHPRFSLYEADVRNTDGMRRICRGNSFDAIVHLAAMVGDRYSVENGPLYADVNVHGVVNLLEAARNVGIPHFVFASTASVYGNTGLIPFREDDPLGHPMTPYPATKIAGEVMGHAYHTLFGLTFISLRLFSIYGPRGRPDMAPYRIMDSIVHEREFPLFNAGEMYRDWTFIGDAVAGILAAIDRPLGYQVINLGRGEPVRMTDFVRLAEKIIGKPAWISTPPAPPSELLITYADIVKARDFLDYRPVVALDEGLARMWEWYQAEAGR